MKQARETATCRSELAQLLPWHVNGTLPEGQARQLAAHLEQCPACRQELRAQQQLRGLMRAPVQLEYAPQAGLRKLMQRIDAEAKAVHPARAPAPARPWLAGLAALRRPRGLVAWLSAAVLVQALALSLLLGLTLWRPDMAALEAAPRYLTLSSQPAGEARLRVLFAPSLSLAELQGLLQAHQLVAVAGPSEAGLFTLALRGSPSTPEALAAVLARLRADPRVRFAEPLAAAPR